MSHYHLSLRDGRWSLTQEGWQFPLKTFQTKKEGVAFSLCYLEESGGTLTIHKFNGSKQEERTYPGGIAPIGLAA